MEKLKFLIIDLIILPSGTSMACAEDVIDFEFTAGFFSKYIWRGQNLNDDRVFQPGFSISYGGFTASIWGNLELTNINSNNNEFTEVDYTLDYAGDFPLISGAVYSVGLIYYDFPNTMTNDTTELYWGLSFDLPASPSITFYHDLEEAEGTYISLGVVHSVEKIVELWPRVPVGMEMGASIGWGSDSYNKYYWTSDQSNLQDITISISFHMELVGWTMAPSLNYVTLVNNDIRDNDTYGTDSDFFLASLSFSKRF